MDDLTWKERGRCFDSDSSVFFVIKSKCANEKEYNDKVEKAQAICNGCPVQAPCAAFGETQEYGIWGGVVR